MKSLSHGTATTSPSPTALRRRNFGAALGMGLGVGAALSVVGWSSPAWAGTYLDRAALMLAETEMEGDLLRRRPADKELAAGIRRLAELRIEIMRKMNVPKAVGKAHPHLLLSFENAHQSAKAAEEGDMKRFIERSDAARREGRTFRALIEDAGYRLPVVR